ncbi:hypothetical protein AJ78_00952 [Emergomyces pasteurianus Ep9510]|uniref:SMP domain-containing protein n=1 Tax=Emergomyces pasteurianus Ep9510 TaxID=1447872 RepID=A0A1J9QSB4_9EURO|nr:hypothetical protein AJ78_00952 [Emergomyces pasteurianus Ep9510]
MSGEIPTTEDIRAAAARGRRFSLDDISDISQAESEITGGGPVRQGPAATAQSFFSKQRKFDEKVEEILAKPPDTITKEDARELQSLEGRALGATPGKQSLSAEVQSIADRNEELAAAGRMHIYSSGDGVYITKEDAAEEQSYEAHMFGGKVPKGSLASQMQSSADKLQNVRRKQGGGY